MSPPPKRGPDPKTAPPWRIGVRAPFIKVFQQTYYALADSVRKDRSPSNRERCLQAWDDLKALKQFAFYECAQSGPDKRFLFLANSKDGEFRMVTIGPWNAYCFITKEPKRIIWETIVHQNEFRGLSLAAFLRDAADRF